LKARVVDNWEFIAVVAFVIKRIFCLFVEVESGQSFDNLPGGCDALVIKPLVFKTAVEIRKSASSASNKQLKLTCKTTS